MCGQRLRDRERDRERRNGAFLLPRIGAFDETGSSENVRGTEYVFLDRIRFDVVGGVGRQYQFRV